LGRPAGWVRAAGLLALAGATLGTALDAVHVHTATTVYARPDVLGQPWWVPPLFAAAAIGYGLGRPLCDRLLGQPVSAPPSRRAAAAMGLFVVAYVLSGTAPGGALARSLVLAGVFAAAWLVGDGTAIGLGFAAAGALVGPAVEIVLVRAGAFAYRHPDVAAVAAWLPWLHAGAAVSVGALGRCLVDARSPLRLDPPEGRV
jgi:hypothetical protein